ncbi:MAG: PIN domain-containing protein [Pseudomonadota bacterium]
MAVALPYADTSFLIALHGNDVFTEAARAEVLSLGTALVMSDLSELEYRNALRLLCFRKLITAQDLKTRLASFQKDRDAGRLRHQLADWPMVWSLAEAISTKRTAKERHRMADLLHVALAQSLGVKHFLSFDDRQRKLAMRQGMAVNAL